MTYPYSVALASAATASGNYPSTAGIVWEGQSSTIVVSGVFNNAIITLQVQDTKSLDWVTVQNGTWTAAEIRTFTLAKGLPVRLNIANAGASTSINANIYYFKFNGAGYA